MIIYYTEQGRIVHANMELLSTRTSDYIEVDVFDPMKAGSMYVQEGTLVNIPCPPTEYHQFNWSTKEWEDPRTLDELKVFKRAEIKRKRTQAEHSGVLFEGYIFDSDSTSQARISGAVQLAMIAQMTSMPFYVNWTLSNNSVRLLESKEVVQLGVALGQHVQAQFTKGQALQVQIDAATTKEELDLIKW